MAKKLDLTISGRGATKYRDFTAGYRQSSNVEDRRVGELYAIEKEVNAALGPMEIPSPSPRRGPTQTPKDSSSRGTGTNNQYGGTTGGNTPFGPGSDTTTDDPGPAGLLRERQGYKLSPEEAIKRTYRD